ncbi:MAG: DUF948 domain-containing protein [Deltaproteobacteria bacterium]|nr:DUF948 domain-containing protein [Deltaproteobacteria bacterium]
MKEMTMNSTLATLLTISVTVIAAIMVLILIFLIPVLIQVRRTAQEAEKLIDSVRLQVVPISRDLGLISRDVKSIVQSIHRQVDRVEDGIETVHDMAVRAKEFQIDIQRRIEEPMLQLATVFSGVKRGIEVFAGIFRR